MTRSAGRGFLACFLFLIALPVSAQPPQGRGGRAGPWRWTRTCEVLTVDEPWEISWQTLPTRLIPDSTRWCLRLQPATEGTRIVQSFEVVHAPPLLDRVFALLVPRHQDRDARLVEDLERIGPVARRGR